MLVAGFVGILFGPAMAAAEVPLTIQNGYPMVPVEVAGKSRLFVLDTGAEGSAVYPKFAEEQRLPVAASEPLIGQTGEADLPTRTITALSLDRRTAGPIQAIELPARRDGLQLAGIIGLDVIGKSLLDMDAPRGRLALLTDEAAARVVKRAGTPVRARKLIGGLLAVPVMVNDVSGWAVIDTGARETRVNSVYARASGLIMEDSPPTSVSGATQNPVAVSTARARQARFLGQKRQNTSVRVVDLPVFAAFGLANEPAMLLGIDWLAKHRLIIDFQSGRVWLK